MEKTITLTVEDSLYNTLKRAADGERRTLSNFMEYAAIHYIFNNNIVDDNEMEDIAGNAQDITSGLKDIAEGRFAIIG